VAQLTHGLELHPKVTYLIGENGSGKPTQLAAIAIAAGMKAEGGSSNYAFPTEGSEADAYAFSQRPSQTRLAESIRLVRGTRRPNTDFFLRAESLFVAGLISNSSTTTHSWATAESRCTSSHTARASSLS